ncbi:MAG TPA: hypothetical protein VMU17_05790, partial [Elusimicrobiota bacterium]|nr:hypothetical protein [Elusimicrobiota bacterium]
MSSGGEDDFEDDTTPADEWEEFREGDGDFIGLAQLKQLDLSSMPEDVRIPVLDDYFPETTLWRDGESIICEIQEHLYTKYWEHKFSAYAFADAMLRAVRRLMHEGHPLSQPSRDDDDDVHIFVRWDLSLPRSIPAEAVI